MSPDPVLVLAGQPLLEFQPAVDLATGRLLGFEALVRWNHPTRGNIPPGVIIPWAEANNEIITLNAWVLTEACHQAQMWSSAIQLAVNCSLVQLRQGEASRAVASALESSGLNPDRLTVEITERTVADDDASADLRALTALGVHLAVDDVGTSWSTLQPLRRFQIETVKIDGAFISSLEASQGMNRAIVEAIIHVAHSLAMSTVAEGVETTQQVALLREFGADVGQGFFFARPVSDATALELATADPRTVFALTMPPPPGLAVPKAQPTTYSVVGAQPQTTLVGTARDIPIAAVSGGGVTPRSPNAAATSPVNTGTSPDPPEETLSDVVAEATHIVITQRMPENHDREVPQPEAQRAPRDQGAGQDQGADSAP